MWTLLRAPFLLLSWLGAPATFIVGVLDTWSTGGPAWLNLLINLTIDMFLAAIWPITWGLWLAMHAVGQSTPLQTVFGW
jgi:hypothetical protein